jgi:F-type H+-transporting ATPase subunit epsilon
MPIELEIITPQGSQFRHEADEVTAPSLDGEFGVLPGHLPILAALRTGIVHWKTKTDEGFCAVGGGFIQVSDDHAIILTDRYIDQKSVNPVEVRKDLGDINAEIAAFKGAPNSPELETLISKQQFCGAQLVLNGDPPPETIRLENVFSQREAQSETEQESTSEEKHLALL